MKFNLKIALLVFIFWHGLILGQKKWVTVEVGYFSPYCGGARPSEEMVAESQKKKPYADKKLILVSEKNKIDSVKTDQQGKFKIKLKEGKYKVMEPWRYYKSTRNGIPPQNFNKECLENEWLKEAIEIQVAKNKISINAKNEIIEYCEWAIPCILESHLPPMRE